MASMGHQTVVGEFHGVAFKYANALADEIKVEKDEARVAELREEFNRVFDIAKRDAEAAFVKFPSEIIEESGQAVPSEPHREATKFLDENGQKIAEVRPARKAAEAR